MTEPVRGISSMATRQVLAELAAAFERERGTPVAIESVGGVDAARRVQAGEAFDLVFLAADATERLAASGHLLAGSRLDLMHSPVVAAVRAGAARPDIGSEEALKRAVLAAGRIGTSTGPSGTHLARLFERWGVAAEVAGRTVQAPPGVPVGRLLADGAVDLGFQQLSELAGLPGVAVLGTLPGAAGFITTFCGAVGANSRQPGLAREVLRFMQAPAHAATKRRHGMEPA